MPKQIVLHNPIMYTQNFMEISFTLPRLCQLKFLNLIMDIITLTVEVIYYYYRENVTCTLKYNFTLNKALSFIFSPLQYPMELLNLMTCPLPYVFKAEFV